MRQFLKKKIQAPLDAFRSVDIVWYDVDLIVFKFYFRNNRITGADFAHCADFFLSFYCYYFFFLTYDPMITNIWIIQNKI